MKNKNVGANCVRPGNKGITLIALVITIIIMLILVAVTVNYSVKSGLLSKAKEGGVKQDVEQERETLTAAVAAAYDALTGTIEKTALGKELGTGWNVDGNSTSYTVTSPKNNKFTVDANGKVEILGNSTPGGNGPKAYVEVTDLTSEVTSVSYNDLKTYDSSLGTQLKAGADEGKIVAVIKEEIKGVETLAPIPKGFTVSSEGTEQKISTGLVIYEGTEAVNVATDTTTRNQFVWVPVPDVVKESTKEVSNTYKPMVKLQSGSTENYEGVLYDFFYDFSGTTSTEKSGYGLSTNEDSTPSYREPVILDNLTYAPDSSKGISNMQGKFNTMVESIQNYGGFYVGRYEATNMNGSKATVIAGTKTGISDLDWYTMYSKLNGIYQEDDPVKAEMIWGCQWDAMLNWMLTGADKDKVTQNSNGNHSGNLANAGDTRTYVDVINNVYDLEGNAREWTQEANYTDVRVYRGGNCYYSSSPADRDGLFPTYSNDSVGSRATLYIK